MELPPSIDRTEFRKFLASGGGGPLIESAWPCDPIGTCASLIEAHNAYGRKRGWVIEEKFLKSRPPVQHLDELLWDDFEYLKKGAPVLDQIERTLFFAEAAVPTLNAFHAEFGDDRGSFHLISFHSPLIHFINAAHSKLFVLMHDNRYAEALPEDQALFDTSEYSDTNLLACLFNDIEVLYDQERLHLPFTPAHVASPYDYCEWVEGTRRFILAHELGHVLFDSSAKPVDINEKIPAGLLGADIPKWHEEYWCDTFAILTILGAYDGKDLNVIGADLYECQNALIGVLLQFIIAQIIEAVLGANLSPTKTHPPAKARLDSVRRIIKSHPAYLHNKYLPDILNTNWMRITAFYHFMGGANAPLAFGSLWSSADFVLQLSPFGSEAYRALLDSLTLELGLYFDGDRALQRMDANSF